MSTPVPNSPLDPRHAVYVGSFDPLTLGHWDLICRGADIFDRLTVGIGINPDKRPLFSPEERLRLTRDLTARLDNVRVECFEGLAVDFVRDHGAAVMLRGIRTLTDMEAEFRMTLANHSLDGEIETVFLMASEEYTHISSSLIKQVARMGRASVEDQLASFLPEPIIRPVIEKYRDDLPPSE